MNNLNETNTGDQREKILKLVHQMRLNLTATELKIPDDINKLLRKIYIFLRDNVSFIRISFSKEDSEQDKKEEFPIDDKWNKLNECLKQWIETFFQYVNNKIFSGEEENNLSTSDYCVNMYFFIISSFFIFKEINITPKNELHKIIVENINYINNFLLYQLSSYFLTENQTQFFIDNYYLIMQCSTKRDPISFKLLIIIKHICLYYLSNCFNDKKNLKKIESFFESCSNYLKANPELKSYKSKMSNSFLSKFNFFNKKQITHFRELDATALKNSLTVLNYSEVPSNMLSNNITVFSYGYEIILFIYNNKVDSNNSNDILKEFENLLYSYCKKIFEQSENFLESTKDKRADDYSLFEYKMNLIEATMLESLKIINILSKLQPSLVSSVQLRMKQVYERVALREIGICLIEILQFFFDNYNSIIVDLDSYMSEFIKRKLILNFKNEILSYSTLAFLYRNKEIIHSQTSIFIYFFPIFLKLFCYFPRYLNSKFFELLEYFVQPETFSEIFNYILDLPLIIQIIESFQNYHPFSIDDNQNVKISDMFNIEYSPLVEFLLRDSSYDKDYQNRLNYYSLYEEKFKFLYDNLILTSRVISTTKIIAKFIDKLFEVIITREEILGACEVVEIIFERFSNFHGNENYKENIRNLLVKKTEEIFKKWPQIVTELLEKILFEIKENFNNEIKRELICCLLWSLGEFLTIKETSQISINDNGVKMTFDCLEEILNQNILSFYKEKTVTHLNSFEQMKKEANMINDLLFYYSDYFIDKTTDKSVSNERILTILIKSLGKLSFKFKSYKGRIIKCFIDIKSKLSNVNLIDTLSEMLVSFDNISIQTQYIIY